jgi:hypothetical protein
MKKLILSSITFFALLQTAKAQDEFDVIRYGMTNVQGTSRGTAIGGALGSIGGDFGSLSVNPAGIGIYKKSELALSTSFVKSNNESTYLGETRQDNDSKLTLSHLGIVGTRAYGNSKKSWRTASFAFGFNRVASFSNEYGYSAKNTKSSIAEKWAEDFNILGGITAKNRVNNSAFGAYKTFIVDLDNSGIGADSNRLKSYVPFSDGIRQTKFVTESGGMNEFVLSVGGNYAEQLMLGATVGIPTVNYKRFKAFSEEDVSGNNDNDFKYLKYYENLTTTGVGVNLKIGAIYKANKNFRAGIALHTPSIISLTDKSSIGIETDTDSFLIRKSLSKNSVSTFKQDSILLFEYTQTTPYKAVLSMSYLFYKFGFITGDVEYVDYSSMKYDFGNNYENETRAINTKISNTYKQALNVRLGAEAKLQDVSFRVGYAFYGSPSRQNTFAIFNSSANINEIKNRSIISFGIGYRTDTWFVDAAYAHTLQNANDVPYSISRIDANVQNASVKNTKSNINITLGFKFK